MGKEFFNKGEQLIKDNFDRAVEGTMELERIGEKAGFKENKKKGGKNA